MALKLVDFHYLAICSYWLNTQGNQYTVLWIENKQTKTPPSKGKIWQVAEVEQKGQAKSKDLQTPEFNSYFPSHFLPSSNPNLAWLSALWSKVTWLGLRENVILHPELAKYRVSCNKGKHSKFTLLLMVLEI